MNKTIISSFLSENKKTSSKGSLPQRQVNEEWYSTVKHVIGNSIKFLSVGGFHFSGVKNGVEVYSGSVNLLNEKDVGRFKKLIDRSPFYKYITNHYKKLYSAEIEISVQGEVVEIWKF